MPKLTPEVKEQLQAILCQQSLEHAKKRQKLLKHKRDLRTIKTLEDSSSVPFLGRMAGAVGSSPLPGSKVQELEGRLEKRKQRTGPSVKLRQTELTEEEKRALKAKVR